MLRINVWTWVVGGVAVAGLLASGAGVAAETRRWEDEIVYVVNTAKFWDGDHTNNYMLRQFGMAQDRYEGGLWGGDLKGVTARLNDLADLGVTALLLYPVVQNDEQPMGKYLPGGYRPKDYEQVDRNFGDEAILRQLVAAAHARRMLIILDMPITFPGFEHPFLADPTKKGWFGETSVYGVPRWKAENPAVADYLIGVCQRWKERTKCDGFRIDSAHVQPAAFWKRFVTAVKSAPPHGPFVILPELPLNPRDIGKLVTECGFDGAYDFSVTKVRAVFGRGQDVGQLAFVNREARQCYPAPRTMMAPIDNYEDTFVAHAQEPKVARTRLALTYILMLDRVPLLYAGDELAIAFKAVGGAFPASRKNSPVRREIQSLISLRKREPALRRGDFNEVFCRNAVYAFLRTLNTDRILVVLNSADHPQEFTAPLGECAWRNCRLEDLLADGVAKLTGSESAINVDAFGARILRVK